ncbi:MAG TPA: hypothetical protein VKG63_06850 [Steroidobacteraceae bacterium]|nr:hypothetical protein [Steroidobacteraceae bacterium]
MRPVRMLGVGLMLAASAGWAGTGDVISAVWKEQHLSLLYMGRTSRYTCDGLRDKVRAMLIDLGARRDLEITALGCEGPAAQVRLASPGPSLNIVVSTPALPASKPRPQRAADSRLVAARFEPFTITSNAFRNMGIADCELVEEFTHQILPKLVTRGLTQDITCVPFQESGGRYLVRGEVLRALPPR